MTASTNRQPFSRAIRRIQRKMLSFSHLHASATLVKKYRQPLVYCNLYLLTFSRLKCLCKRKCIHIDLAVSVRMDMHGWCENSTFEFSRQLTDVNFTIFTCLAFTFLGVRPRPNDCFPLFKLWAHSDWTRCRMSSTRKCAVHTRTSIFITMRQCHTATIVKINWY